MSCEVKGRRSAKPLQAGQGSARSHLALHNSITRGMLQVHADHCGSPTPAFMATRVDRSSHPPRGNEAVPC